MAPLVQRQRATARLTGGDDDVEALGVEHAHRRGGHFREEHGLDAASQQDDAAAYGERRPVARRAGEERPDADGWGE